MSGPDKGGTLRAGLSATASGELLHRPAAGFAFVGRQVRIAVGDQEYAIDLLFYHTRLHCFVVLDLGEPQTVNAGRLADTPRGTNGPAAWGTFSPSVYAGMPTPGQFPDAPGPPNG